MMPFSMPTRIARTKTRLYLISTVLPTDDVFFGTRAETMVFLLKPNENDSIYTEIDVQYYRTLEEAKLGHKQMVKKYKKMENHSL